ncbi:phage tail tape measure protein [uncultured Pseudomonas sp.]|uniref:phage tail tape measure protein n=1 Tax=uncultured Pseudomonas sp. TaxID=114707 RepID=UPI0025D58841|nr:phage tail tape measure protein [uncultured Pseudomonas sp.]
MADRSAKLDFIMRLNDQITAPLAKVKMGMNDLAETGEKYIKQAGIGLAGMVGAGVAISKALEPALEQNRALGEVKSLGVAQDALDALNRKSLQFSVAYGENARDFVASAYSIEGAIKGLTGSQLATFTNASNVLAKATKTDAATMGTYVGTMYNLFKGQADAMGKGAWVENLAGQTALSVQLFRTSGAQIGEAFKAAGGLASTAGVDLAEQMAVLGTLSSTMDGGAAGGAYKAFFENITGASEKLGMSFTDQPGRLLPMLDILQKLQGRFGDLSIEANGKALRDAFGGEAARLITTLMTDTSRLSNGIDQLGRVRGLEQAARMAKDMTDPWQQFLSVVQALRVVFGQVLIPLLSPLIERLVGVVNVLVRWTQLFPNISRVIGIATLAVLGLVGAVAGLTMINAVFGMLGVLVSPIALIVLGLGALVIGIGAAIYYWDNLKASFGNTAWFQALVTILTPVVLLLRVFGALVNVLWVGLQQIVGAGVQVVAWLSELEGVTAVASAIWDGFIWGLTNLSPFALLGRALQGLIALLNKIPGINIDASFAELPSMPGSPEIKSATPVPDPVPVPPAIAAALQASRQDLVTALPSAPVEHATRPDVSTIGVQLRDAISATAPSLAPQRANAVPRGGLLSSIQNSTSQNKGNHIEKVEIHTSKPMTPLELENMMEMAAG